MCKLVLKWIVLKHVPFVLFCSMQKNYHNFNAFFPTLLFIHERQQAMCAFLFSLEYCMCV